jgi:hypothetical protein
MSASDTWRTQVQEARLVGVLQDALTGDCSSAFVSVRRHFEQWKERMKKAELPDEWKFEIQELA